MPRGLFRLLEVSAYLRCAVFVHVHIRKVPDSEFGYDLRCALLIAEHEDIDIGMQTRPALDRVALNHPDVPEERLRQREDRDHGRPPGTGCWARRSSCSFIPASVVAAP